MNRKFVNVYFIFALIVFVFSVVLFITNTHADYKNGVANAQWNFKQISEDFNNGTLIQLVTSLKENNIVADAQVSCNNKLIFQKNGAFDFNKKRNAVSVFAGQNVKNSDTYYIQVAYYNLTPYDIYKNSRLSFLIILVTTLATGILIFLAFLDEKKKSNNKAEKNASKKLSADEDNNQSEYVETENKTEKHKQSSDFDSDSELAPELMNEKIEFPEDNSTEQKSQIDFDDGIFESTNQDEVDELIWQPAPKLDFGDESDFDVQKETENQIDSEIDYSAIQTPDKIQSVDNVNIFEEETQDDATETVENNDSTENNESLSESLLAEKLADENLSDVSLFLYHSEKEEIRESVKNLFNQPQFNGEHFFDFDDSTVAVIKENCTIDEAEELASEIHSTIMQQTENAVHTDLNIGISSKSTRKISADRLISEAKEALKHSLNDNDSQIIGFHVDIEKYNEIMSNKN